MLVDSSLWAVLPYGDQTAWQDFLGQHDLWHQQFDRYIRENFAADPFFVMPLGDGGAGEWDEAHQLMHEGESASLLLPGPPDFRSFDRSVAEQFASWAWIHSQEHQLLQATVGL